MVSNRSLQNPLKILFALIAGASCTAAIFTFAVSLRFFVPGWSRVGITLAIVSALFFLEAFGALGLMTNWFFGKIRPGRVVNILQWIAGILGIAGIFDLVMRFTRASAWMVSGILPFVLDAIFIVLFFLWLFVSHYIQKDAKERKVCQFC